MTTAKRLTSLFVPALATALLTVALSMPLAIAPIDPSLVTDGPIVDLFDVVAESMLRACDANGLRLTQPQIFRG